MKKINDFDKAFDNNEDISEFVDYSKATRPNQQYKNINIKLPVWLIDELDKEAKTQGVKKEVVVEVILAQRLQSNQI